MRMNKNQYQRDIGLNMKYQIDKIIFWFQASQSAGGTQSDYAFGGNSRVAYAFQLTALDRGELRNPSCCFASDHWSAKYAQ